MKIPDAKEKVATASHRGGTAMTMADLATLASVSKITVSRALRDSSLVREEVRTRIKELAEAHGYRLNAAARSLRTRRAHSVTAVLEMDPASGRPYSDPLILTVIGGLLQTFAMQRYRLVLTTRAEIVSATSVVDADGLILFGQGANDEAFQQMRRFNLPLVVWGSARAAFDDVAFVGSDNREGGRLLGAHLAGLGRRRILFLGDSAHEEVADRLAGLTGAVRKSAAKVTTRICQFSREASRAVIAEELDKGWDFDAVAACSDPVALGALDVLESAGMRAPSDVAVTGFDDAIHDPRLTTVRQDWDLAGRTLAGKMLDLLAGEEATSALLPVELVVRASTDA
ncbi:MAG TPA: substrate-binding domain-containing protein [Caulobacteraceae bacterium]|jgi:DNA-binding LacI/PurR family transcriptional regulator